MIREYFGGHLMQNSLGIPYEDQGSSWLYFFSVNDVCKVKTVINKKKMYHQLFSISTQETFIKTHISILNMNISVYINPLVVTEFSQVT